MERVNSLLALFLVVFVCSLASGTVLEGVRQRGASESPSTLYEPGKQLAHVSRLPHGINGDCNLDNGKVGVKWCHEAFKSEFDQHSSKILQLRDILCCLSYNMAQCVHHSYEEADCSASNKNIRKLVDDEVEDAQKEAGKWVSTLGAFVCKDDAVSESKCDYLDGEFDKAEKRIKALNGAATLGGLTIVPFLTVACSLLMFFRS